MVAAEAPVGAAFRVRKVTTGKEIGKRLADMGFTEGAEGMVVRAGLLRDPLQLRIRGYDVLVRRSEAAKIEVDLAGPEAEPGALSGTGRGEGSSAL